MNTDTSSQRMCLSAMYDDKHHEPDEDEDERWGAPGAAVMVLLVLTVVGSCTGLVAMIV
ncbi:hypothetical protein [Roseivivax jejudonensis]|uniref:hypothetical protein n=1 Tax=Roseivivax jejudonensis TaxID=1529041 RepID=UPI00135664CC|nr:hypothetical protein [Roseivivax jejudonensis]